MYSVNGSYSIENRNSYTPMQPEQQHTDFAGTPSQTLMLTDSIESRRENIARVEAAIEAICTDANIAKKRVFFITLATSEALCNIIEHGYAFEPGHHIDIAVYRTPNDTLEVALSDNASEMPQQLVTKLTSRHCQMPDTDTTLEQLPESNWGTNLIGHTTSEVRYTRTNDKNHLTLCFSL